MNSKPYLPPFSSTIEVLLTLPKTTDTTSELNILTLFTTLFANVLKTRLSLSFIALVPKCWQMDSQSRSRVSPLAEWLMDLGSFRDEGVRFHPSTHVYQYIMTTLTTRYYLVGHSYST